jgi:hypothetical protein
MATAAQPDPPRLFDLDVSPPSQLETRHAPSHSRTPEPLRDSQTETATDPLQAVREAATLEAAARARLANAITTARAAGHSWRTLGIASGIPHQTLHRRLRHPDRDS